MPLQLDLDFKRKIRGGKKTARLSIPCSDEFLELVDKTADLLNTDRAKLGHRLVLEGLQRAIGTIFMSEPYEKEKLGDLIAR